jgi:hypothetical protein
LALRYTFLSIEDIHEYSGSHWKATGQERGSRRGVIMTCEKGGFSFERPNWKEPDLYPDPDSTTPFEWAQQFILRNENFTKEPCKFGALDLPGQRNALLGIWPSTPGRRVELDNLMPWEVPQLFDLRFPIQDQLEKTKELLKRLQSRKEIPFQAKRYRPELYVYYLRILDAKASGVPHSKIADVLFLGEEDTLGKDGVISKVSKQHSAAKKLVEESYIHLSTLIGCDLAREKRTHC